MDSLDRAIAGTPTLRYALSEASAVRLAVYDVPGREVALLMDREQAAGHHEVTLEAGQLPSGLYFCELQANTFRAVHPVVLNR